MTKAPRNRTLTCSRQELAELSGEILNPNSRMSLDKISGRVAQGDVFRLISLLPDRFVDLLILDPPYNLSKNYHGTRFHNRDGTQYQAWFESLLDALMPTLKPHATIYVCSEWRTSVLIGPILQSRFHVHNRITWEREKGRGARSNWKNNSEDIWYCTRSADYFFDAEAVRLKRKVIAPYRVNGDPKDWAEEENGNFRLTFPSNIWTDITVPFWSMRENTDHPTQKPEKLIAKLMLASSRNNDFVFDPFLGSGTTAVVATKLGRRWFGMDCNQEYLCWALKRIRLARQDPGIQGYRDEVFWERNSANTG
ncbi:MAG: DNA methyltransferase [Acidiferrobacterales bacterium]|nr:DNA methyltransferase [Acidiferrobacterales bacterium]